MDADDASLVAQVLAGDAGAYATLLHRHFAVAFATARALTATPQDAEDVCQDAFSRAYFRLADCRSPSQFRAWLVQIVRHRAHNIRAYQLLRAGVSPDEVAEPVAADSPADDLERSELRDRLRAALALLTPVKRSVVVHHDVDGWTHAMIAEQLGISVVMSRRHLSDARRQLRALLVDLDLKDPDDELS